MKNFYISDIHFGHGNVLRFDNRPFFDLSDMEQGIISNWNSVVDNSDMIYILGDFCWSKEDEWIRILSQLKGNKTLIIGNHDLKHCSKKLKNCFNHMTDYEEITDNNKKIIMSHYPIMCYKHSCNENTWMLHGHTHKTFEQDYVEKWTEELIQNNIRNPQNSNNHGHIMNVGCMESYMNYTPQTIDTIIAAWNKKYDVNNLKQRHKAIYKD